MPELYLIAKISLVASVFSFLGEPDELFAWYRKLIMRLPDWLNKPLGSCHRCLSGQAVLWIFLFTQPFDFFGLLFYVSLGIFLSQIYYIIWNL